MKCPNISFILNKYRKTKKDEKMKIVLDNAYTELKDVESDNLKTVSIIIPVHNNKDLLDKCVKSIKNKTTGSYSITLVDDGSEPDTTKFCQELRNDKVVDCLLRNEKPLGFSISCNRGLRSVKADYYCLLNSDAVIGTDDWFRKIIDVGELDVDIGVLGVVSNKATSQSIVDEEGGELPDDWTPDAFASLIESLSENNNPITGFVNGFCYIIKDEALADVGGLDEDRYPHYGSEDDLTLRMFKAGLKTMIVDSVFVYHKHNSSYKDKRKDLVNEAVSRLTKNWGKKLIEAKGRQSWNAVKYLRDKVNKFLSDEKQLEHLKAKNKAVLSSKNSKTYTDSGLPIVPIAKNQGLPIVPK